MDLPGGAIGLDKIASVDARACLMNWVLAVQFDGSNIAQHYDVLASLNSRWILDHHGKFLKGAKPDGPEVDMVKRLIDKGNCWFKFQVAMNLQFLEDLTIWTSLQLLKL